jgi:hypothetical protein
MQDGLYGVVKRNKFLADYTSKKGKMFSNKSLENVQLGLGFQEQVYVSLEELLHGHQYVASKCLHPLHSSACGIQIPYYQPRAANTPWGAKIAPGRTLARLGKHGFVL